VAFRFRIAFWLHVRPCQNPISDNSATSLLNQDTARFPLLTRHGPVRFQFGQGNGAIPMNGRDPIVMQAMRNVVSRRSSDDWWALPARQRTEVIYAEVKRLDSVAIQQGRAAHEQPDPTSAYAVV
jgi:hypothetical protein